MKRKSKPTVGAVDFIDPHHQERKKAKHLA